MVLHTSIAFVVAVVAVSSMTSEVAASTPSGPLVYEISTRPWLYELSLKYGRTIKLADVPAAEFQAIADKGMDVVWLMGAWTLGAYGLNHDRTDPSLLASYASVLPGYTTVRGVGDTGGC